MSQNYITPKKLQGFWELSPEKQIAFDNMKNKIEKVFQTNCFFNLDTPVLEHSEILLAKSGGEIDKEVYVFTKGSTSMGLRFDFTVPLARFVAMNVNTLDFPFKRYQIGKVYRGEKPQKGRYREFYQCDADIIGNEELSLVADAECVKLYHDAFSVLGYDEVVEISNRNLLFGLIEDCRDQEYSDQIITLLDKYDKIGEENLVKGLHELGLRPSSIEKYVEAIKIKGGFSEVETKLTKLSQNEIFVKAINELKELNSYLEAFNLPKDSYIYNLGIIRGHNYYTGTVFEVYLKNNRRFGALGGGGRYENLAGYFTDKKLPGVGMSIGLTRLFSVLDDNGMLPVQKKTNIDIAIIPLGETLRSCLTVCEQLRKKNIKAEVLYENKSFKSKMKEANKKEIPYVLIVGEDEIKTGKFALKNMQTGNQESLTIEDIIIKF